MQAAFTALRAFTFAAGFLLLWLWVGLRLRSLDLYLGARLPGWTAALGILCFLVGGSLVLTCMVLFIVQGHGTPAPFDAPRRFVAIGPYKIVRNPMYIGGLTLLVGLALFEHSKSILFFCPVWFLLAHAFVVFYEEPSLAEKFGGTYQGYCKAVPRWIPTW